MFAHLVLALRSAGLPASTTEYLTLMGAMKAGVAEYSVEDFYYLARATLVKDERHLDKFDRVFAQCFKGLEPPARYWLWCADGSFSPMQMGGESLMKAGLTLGLPQPNTSEIVFLQDATLGRPKAVTSSRTR